MELRMKGVGDERGGENRRDITGGGASGLSFEDVQDGGYHEGYWRLVLETEKYHILIYFKFRSKVDDFFKFNSEVSILLSFSITQSQVHWRDGDTTT